MSEPPVECCITFSVPKEPVSAPCGHTFELAALEEWKRKSNLCPMCREELPTKLAINLALRGMIESWYQLQEENNAQKEELARQTAAAVAAAAAATATTAATAGLFSIFQFIRLFCHVQKMPPSDDHDEDDTNMKIVVKDSIPENNKKVLQLIDDKSHVTLDITHYFNVFATSGLLSFYIYFPPFIPLIWKRCRWLLGVLAAPIALSALYPIDDEYQPEWTKSVASWIIRKSAEYFHFRIYFEDYDAVNAHKQAVIAFVPHDIWPLGVNLFCDYLGYFKSLTMRPCLSSAMFSLPVFRHFMAWIGAIAVEKSAIIKIMEKGQTPAICPGGVKEVSYLTTHDAKEIIIHLRSRLGIVKLAAQFGVPIIPAFTFNQRKTLDFWCPQTPWIHQIARKMGFMPLIFFGLFGIPIGPPKPANLSMVVGSPIPVRKMTLEEMEQNIDELKVYNQLLVDAVERIFEENKAMFDMQDNILIIR